MLPFELNTTYTLITEKGAITPQGKDLIEDFISKVQLSSPEWTELNPESSVRYMPPLPDVDGFSWFWNVQRGDYRGTFPKRVSKWYKLNHGLNCPDTFLEKIGNIARQHSLDAYTYTFDFVNDFEWESGDFGDSGSCYWNDHSEARELLENNGCLAIRFFEDNHGFARAWFFPAGDFYVIFNGYGMTTLEIAKIFATWQLLDYKKIHLYNNRESAGLIYINGSGSGYVVGEQAKIVNISKYDFEIYTPHSCERCGRDMGENGYTTPNDEEWCSDCFYDLYDYCYHCDSACHRDNLTYIESVERDVCDYCLNRYYSYCDYCDSYYPDNEVEGDENGVNKCRGCRGED